MLIVSKHAKLLLGRLWPWLVLSRELDDLWRMSYLLVCEIVQWAQRSIQISLAYLIRSSKGFFLKVQLSLSLQASKVWVDKARNRACRQFRKLLACRGFIGVNDILISMRCFFWSMVKAWFLKVFINKLIFVYLESCMRRKRSWLPSSGRDNFGEKI